MSVSVASQGKRLRRENDRFAAARLRCYKNEGTASQCYREVSSFGGLLSFWEEKE